MDLPWIVILSYVVILILVCLRIIYETHSSTKTIAYLLFCIFAPVIGILFYLAFGINYWRKKLYTRKSDEDLKILEDLKKTIPQYNEVMVSRENLQEGENAELAAMLISDLHSPLTRKN